MGYETMDGERNIEQEAALKKFDKTFGLWALRDEAAERRLAPRYA
jgi:hypothetical protein